MAMAVRTPTILLAIVVSGRVYVTVGGPLALCPLSVRYFVQPVLRTSSSIRCL